ncbi:hypothetical protein CEXT_142851 [Caerostris extrusa]|uniref:Uncharacterized protein n=1 Tax=Caerostris extrusa TaxID=172846 RepID=A0AAV4RW71_CAEEX|nr:hypothetical protein CEXT_142851 [Caerostris extrusa]
MRTATAVYLAALLSKYRPLIPEIRAKNPHVSDGSKTAFVFMEIHMTATEFEWSFLFLLISPIGRNHRRKKNSHHFPWTQEYRGVKFSLRNPSTHASPRRTLFNGGEEAMQCGHSARKCPM